MASLTRMPGPLLRPFVQLLWACDDVTLDAGPRRELMLPTGTAHLVVRLSDGPLRIFTGLADVEGSRFAEGVVGGPRSAAYVKHAAPRNESVGALLHPGVAALLLGAPARALAEQHVALDALWGRAASELRERLGEVRTLAERLDLFERSLLARLPKVRGVHPAVAHGVAQLSAGAQVAQVVEASGYSHRGYIALFKEASGFSPKVFARLMRFQRALSLVHGRSELGLSDVALRAGYSDQAHMTREFVGFASIAPGALRAARPRDAHHVPLEGRGAVALPGQIRSRPGDHERPS